MSKSKLFQQRKINLFNRNISFKNLNLNKNFDKSFSTFNNENKENKFIKIEEDFDPLTNKKTGVLKVFFNNPSKLNAMTVSLGEEFRKTIETLSIQQTLKALILTGSGKAFSAGGDLDFLSARTKISAKENYEEMLLFYNRYMSMRTLQIPILAAINGDAIGAGLGVALATDLRIVASDAKLGLTFTKLGIHPGMGSTHFLPKIVGPQIAAKMLLTSEIIDGKEAVAIGLALAHYPKENVLEETVKLARRIAAVSPAAVKQLIPTLRGQLDTTLTCALEREATAQAITYQAPDLIEGLKAVIEKRSPNFE
eukprot:TRINITY_DN1015_c1_g2_i2.p1 TRINITY_DN1015_c1_g2~~TRINITY_DN1015_c1_g2_i2.p1  ORF type:complete len:325 (+),score=168.14 TRINITY_DN1015_c1_g2_i2:46-975(+)